MAAAQLPLNLPHVSGSARDDLIASPANRAAIELIDAWPAWPSALAVLVGPQGSGKTHMGMAWAGIARARVLAMRELPHLREVGPDDRLFLIEDARSGAVPERALFHLLNHVRANHGFCLLTGRERPAGWAIALPDLASRLRTAAVVEIGEPDDKLLGGVLFKLLADRQLSVEPSVIDYAVARMPRSLAVAGRLAEAIDAEALSRNRRIGRALVAGALKLLSAEGGADNGDNDAP